MPVSGEQKKSIRIRQSTVDAATKRNEIMAKIEAEEENFGVVTISKSVQRNVVLVGRTRTGKSTIKAMLMNPVVIAEEQQLMSGTKEPVFDTLHITWKKRSEMDESSEEEYSEIDPSKENLNPTTICEDLALNIIDTPGLFERGSEDFGARDNEIIMKAIDACINSEITKFHVICFCVALTSGINQEDIQALKLLLETIGSQISSNACLLITHCESKDKDQLKALRAQLRADQDFKMLIPYFKKGIFFTGVLKREDYNAASDNLVAQYLTVADFRTKIIKMFSESVKPFPLIRTLISESQRSQQSKEALQAELEQAMINLRHMKEDLTDARSQLHAKTEELQQIHATLVDSEDKLNVAKNELQQRHLDLEEKTNDLVQSKSSEASLRKTIKELQDKSTMNEREREALKTNLELEEKQRREAETEKQRQTEARRDAEKKRLQEQEERRREEAKAHDRYCKQVEAQQEEVRQRRQAERAKEMAEKQLEEANKKPCSIS